MERVKCPKCGRTLLLMEFGKLEIKSPRSGGICKIEKAKGRAKVSTLG